jgi:hypothetical protein
MQSQVMNGLCIQDIKKKKAALTVFDDYHRQC